MSLAAPLVLAFLAVPAVAPRPQPMPVECGERIETTVTLDRDLACGSEGLVVAGDDITIDCRGHSIQTDAMPGVTALRVEGGSSVAIRNCRLIGGWFGIQATGVRGFEVGNSAFEGFLQTTIRVVDSADVAIVANTFEAERNIVSISGSPRVRVERNRFRATSRWSSVHILSSPNSAVLGNDFEGGGFVGIGYGEGAKITHNTISGGVSSISTIRTPSCLVRSNRLHESGDGTGGGITLYDGRDCEVEDNFIERVRACGVLLHGDDPERGGNRVARNSVRGGSYGLCLFESQGDSIVDNDVADSTMGIVAFADPASQQPFDRPTSISGNRIEGTAMGIATLLVGGLAISDNLLQDNEIGIYELTLPSDMVRPANVYADNRIQGNGVFGMAIIGASPVVRGNVFDRNGGATDLSVDAHPIPWMLGDARGAIGLVPAVGDSVGETFDDGIAGNDAVPSPVIGSTEGPNLFRNNIGQDIYGLDARPANAATLMQGNRFLGGVPRLRQTWRGLVRVVDQDGLPVEGAAVRIVDSSGDIVLEAATDSDGVAPAGSDPLRSQGLSEVEPGGPVAGWPILTEAIVDDRGHPHPATPHRIIAARGFETGCAEYSWNGTAEPGEAGTSIDGRYQTAVVRLGSGCAGLLSPSSARALSLERR